MNTAKLRSKRVILPTIAAVAVIGVGGVVWANSASANNLEGSERDRVATAATQAVGGGKVLDAESSDDAGEAYEVEVRLKDGSEVDVTLDEKLDVVSKDYDDDRRDGNDADDTRDDDDADDVNDNDANDTRDDNDADDVNDNDNDTNDNDTNDNDANDTRDADDRVLSSSERTSAEKAAKNAVGGGTIVDVDASDDRGVAYEVEVRKADNTEWNVDLDAKFKVVNKAIDR